MSNISNQKVSDKHFSMLLDLIIETSSPRDSMPEVAERCRRMAARLQNHAAELEHSHARGQRLITNLSEFERGTIQ